MSRALTARRLLLNATLAWLGFATKRQDEYDGRMMDKFFKGSWRISSVVVIAASLFLASFVHASFVHAAEMEALTEKLPRAYLGEFSWDGDKNVQNVVVTFESVRVLNDKNAEAIGCGAYEVNRQVTKIRVRMFVRLSDLQIELLELSPEGSPSFETDGSHRGYLSKDLQRIDAQWTTRASGQRGQLHLRAASSAVCGPAASL
jgi:hypothetical protein